MATNNPYDPLQTSQAQVDFTTQTPDPNQVATAYQADATERQVTPDQLVQSQITSILDGNNPYIKQAEQKAMEYANSRGVLNSSIAANAGRSAAIEAALPIAQQDAGVFERMATDNQNIQTQTNLQNAQAQNTMLQTHVASQQEQEIAKLQADLASEAMGEEQDYKLNYLAADAAVREKLAEIEQGYAVELETLRNEYGILKNQDTVIGTIYDGALRSLSGVLDDPDMSGTAAGVRSDEIIKNLKAALTYVTAVNK